MNKPKYITPILKLTECCNFTCGYCRYANNNVSDKVADFGDVILYIRKCMEFNKSVSVDFLHVIFHGGEPLLWGKDNFRRIIEWQKLQNFKFINSIQTNGYLIDKEWCDIFCNGKIDVGISIDGPEELNGHKLGELKVDKIIKEKIKLLREKKCKTGILSVLTDNHVDAKAYYDFLIKNDIHSVGLCYCYQDEGDAVDNQVLSKFLCDLFDLYFYGEYKIRIREFDCCIEKLLKGKSNSCHINERESCGRYISVLPDGNVRFCDSYDIGGKSYGNLLNNSIWEIVYSENYQSEMLKAKNLIVLRCSNCDVKVLCGGGCYRNDLKNGSKNYFCETYIKVYKHIQECIMDYFEKRGN